MKYENLTHDAKVMAQLMLAQAQAKKVMPTEYLPNVAKARITLKMSIDRCPCAKDDKERGCISAKCFNEILTKGVCHCNAFKKM